MTKMLTLFIVAFLNVLLLVTQLVIGQPQCQQVAASFEGDLNLSSLYVALDDAGVSADDAGSASSGGSFCKCNLHI